MQLRYGVRICAEVSALALLSTFGIQAAHAQDAQATDADVGSSDIVVTARRKDESLRDVPQTVNVVTGAAVEKLNITRFEDIASLTPGLTLQSGSDGFTTTASIRGVGYDSTTVAPPTIEFYLNDALTFPVFLFQSMYDVGQIEVLRGPQGTLRGRASPSGSITVTTRKADLTEVGGYVNMTGTDQGMINVNGAISVPVIRDVLGVRIAGIVDENKSGQVRSLSNGTQPFSRTQGGRISVRFEPTDTIRANVMYSRLHHKVSSFEAVESISLSEPGVPAGAGPIITARDRKGITDAAGTLNETQQILNGNISWSFGGQQLSYVGSYTKWVADTSKDQDFGDVLKGVSILQEVPINTKQQTHELRLSSEDRIFGIFDYTVGAFHSDIKASNPIYRETPVTVDGAYAPFLGLQGTAGTPTLVTVSPITLSSTSRQRETSFFGNLTAHLSESAELSGGVRHILFHDENLLTIPEFGQTIQKVDNKFQPWVYNFSAKYRFSPDLMIYANTGSGWRKGPNATGLLREPTPRLTQFTQLRPETSKSYEVGFKASALDRKLDISVAAFHQDFKNFFYANPAEVSYVNLVNGVETPGNMNFLSNVPVKVNGIDFQADFHPTRNFTLSLLASYAKGNVKNGTIACNDINGDGVPDAGIPTLAQVKASAGAGEAVAVCSTNDRIATSPNWNATIQSEYTVPVSDNVDSFARGLFNFYPKNSNQPTNPYDTVKAYGLLNLYLGIRAPDGAWEVSLFGKNITNTFRRLSVSDRAAATNAQELQVPTFAPTGVNYKSDYVIVTTTAPREFGLNVRFAFGAR